MGCLREALLSTLRPDLLTVSVRGQFHFTFSDSNTGFLTRDIPTNPSDMFLPRLVLQLADCLGPVPLQAPIHKLVVAGADHSVLGGDESHADSGARIQRLLRRAENHPMRHEDKRGVGVRRALLPSHQCRRDDMDGDGSAIAVIRCQKSSLLIKDSVSLEFSDHSGTAQRPRRGGQWLGLHVPLPHYQKQLPAYCHNRLLGQIK
mmetsp:Transcript_52958/g.116246  ORF Transcript_52958/g.116246 Transcript_52958/m.116246 type:complete len:204 (-) Transcript_52958:463-1074(-)